MKPSTLPCEEPMPRQGPAEGEPPRRRKGTQEDPAARRWTLIRRLGLVGVLAPERFECAFTRRDRRERPLNPVWTVSIIFWVCLLQALLMNRIGSAPAGLVAFFTVHAFFYVVVRPLRKVIPFLGRLWAEDDLHREHVTARQLAEERRDTFSTKGREKALDRMDALEAKLEQELPQSRAARAKRRVSLDLDKAIARCNQQLADLRAVRAEFLAALASHDATGEARASA